MFNYKLKSFIFLGALSILISSVPAIAQSCGVEVSSFNRSRSNVSKLEKKIVKNEKRTVKFDKVKLKNAKAQSTLELKVADNEKKIADCQATNGCRKLRSLQNKKALLSRKKAILDKKISRNDSRLSDLKTELPNLKSSLAAEKVKLAAAAIAKEACLSNRRTPTPTATPGAGLGLVSTRYSFGGTTLNSQYPIGQGFFVSSDPGTASPVTSIPLRVSSFFYISGGNSGPSPQTTLNITKDPRSIQNNLGLSPGNVTANFDLPNNKCFVEASFDYLDEGGEINLVVGQDIHKSQDFINLDRKQSANNKYIIKVTKISQSNYQDEGTVKIESTNNNCLDNIGVGGQELFFDNLILKSK